MNLAHALDPPVPLRRPAHSGEAFNRHLLSVRFVAPDGGEWLSVGAGESVAASVAAARAALPPDGEWEPAGWNPLGGDAARIAAWPRASSSPFSASPPSSS
jgi:hypothetical protein